MRLAIPFPQPPCQWAALIVACLLSASSVFAQTPLRDALLDAGASQSDAANLSAAIASTQEAKFTAGDAMDGDTFGWSVSLSGDRALVGARANGGNIGAAYVFSRSGTEWAEEAKLTASDGAPGHFFGGSVSLSGDRALVGARSADGEQATAGAAYVFVRDGTAWTEETKLTASDGESFDRFGESVSISTDRALVGAPASGDNGFQSGSAYVFLRDGTEWTQEAKLTAEDAMTNDSFGRSTSLSGDRALVGAFRGNMGAGAAYVFLRSETGWAQEARLTASDGSENDFFGISASMSGNRALVGASNDDGSIGSAYVYSRSGTTWSQEAKLTAEDGAENDLFGESVALSGDRSLIGSHSDDDRGFNSGAAYVFVRDGTLWSQEGKLTAADGAATDRFGYSVSLSGDRALLGAYSAGVSGFRPGAAYIFSGIQPTVGEHIGEVSASLSAAAPNPVSRRAVLRLTLATPQDIRAILVDALGREISVLFEGTAVGTRLLIADTSSLPPGAYAVSVRGGTIAETRRLTVVR